MIRPTNMINGLLLLAILGFASIQANRLIPVEITPDKQMAVRQGDELKILCKMPVALKVCRFTIPREGSNGLILTPGPQSEDGIDYFGDGLDKGHCGIRLSRARETDDGNYTCALTPNQGRTESYNSVHVIVAREPSTPQLELNQEKYKEGEKMDIVCHADGGKPPANLSLYLEKEQIQYDERPILYNRQGDAAAMLKTSRPVTAEDHGKTLTCTANHIALRQPLSVHRQINVIFPPERQEKIERFGYTIGQSGRVNVTVRANPMPRFTWIVDGQRIPAGQPDHTNRIQTSSPSDQGHGIWIIDLLIDSVQKSDTEKEYVLEAANELGKEHYKIFLSSATEPAGVDLDAGSIIGIVMGVLILILAVFLVVFARATGRWCFAGGSLKRNVGESDLAEPAESVNLLRFVKPKPKTDDASPRRSDTESTGRFSRTEVDTGKNGGRPKISFSQLFKRNKDKVSGADTDTVRTVVTMEDEKIPASDVTMTAQTPTSGNEGGIVYAELDLAHQQPNAPRRITDEKTEYAEILYTKPDGQPHEHPTPTK